MAESSNYVRVHGKVPVGKCAYTGPGNLKRNGVRFVIHAVGPDFKDDESVLKQQMDLYNAVESSLKAANSLGCKSIAIPAISSGIFNFPVPLCAQVIFSAINDFIKF